MLGPKFKAVIIPVRKSFDKYIAAFCERRSYGTVKIYLGTLVIFILFKEAILTTDVPNFELSVIIINDK
jgi:hypothetical protein